jgi:hypothetical protein
MKPRTDSVFGTLLLTWVLGWGSGFVRAAVLMKGWQWFVADTFDVQTINIVEAWGMWILVVAATAKISGDRDTEPTTFRDVGLRIFSSLFLSGMLFLSMIILAGFR